MTTPPPSQPTGQPSDQPAQPTDPWGRPVPQPGNPHAENAYAENPYAENPYAGNPYAPRPEEQPWDPAYYPYAQGYSPPFPYGPPAPIAPSKKRRGPLAAAAVVAIAAITAIVLVFASGSTRTVNGTALGSLDSGNSSTIPSTTPTTPTTPITPVVPGNGTGGSANGGSGSSSNGTATAAQQIGVVDIVSVQKYNQAAAAGTGMVLTADGEILTNNHVIEGSTSIKVTVVTTGKTYTATVVGTSPTNDIALLKLSNASGLQTINLGDSTTVAVGDAVTGVGNAGGKGGTPSSAEGKVTKLNKTITASDESGQNAEKLTGVIVTDAPIQSGDSGGPLYNAKGAVIGIDTAASTSGPSIGFAIPINKALSIVSEIKKGIETSSIHIGYPGFLGISVGQTQTGGALVENALTGGPADTAGIVAGDVITKVGSTTISTSTQLQKAVSSHTPGSKVSITYLDQATGSHTVTVTLATGPAD